MKYVCAVLVKNLKTAMENKDKIISHLVAISNNNVIGVDNNLPWNLKGDLAHFKEYTLNKSIIMGRKTYESIGRPLPNRTNVIISRTLKDIPGAYIYSDLESAISFVQDKNREDGIDNEIVIIGGGYLFRETIKSFNKLVLTRVDCEIEGDIYYPDIDLTSWELVCSSSFNKDADNNYDYKIEESVYKQFELQAEESWRIWNNAR